MHIFGYHLTGVLGGLLVTGAVLVQALLLYVVYEGYSRMIGHVLRKPGRWGSGGDQP